MPLPPLPIGVEAIDLSRAGEGLGQRLSRTGASGQVLPQWKQWSLVNSNANTLRGVHVHLERFDYLLVLRGSLWLGLHDLRETSPTRGRSAMVKLGPSPRQAWIVPPGVGHGFCFTEDTLFCFALSEYWSPQVDEYGCHWRDPALDLTWPLSDPLVSPRDREAGSVASLRQQLATRPMAVHG
jgi:dTDP-4-dehydrorhamnose 3,5-epimerase